VVLVGHDPASEVYVRGKRADAERVGITSSDHRLPDTATTEEIIEVVRQLNADERVSGLLVQTPLPAQVAVAPIVEAVDPAKDVDGAHPVNAGRLLLGEDGLVACTPAGILRLLEDHQVPVEGRRAVVIGRSNTVGKPAALLLLRRNATVTICHSKTADLPGVARQADLIVAAIGRACFVTPDMVKPGAAVVDVGITREGSKLHGDVDPDVAKVAGWLSPVPGGVGPMTRGMLMWNTLKAERLLRP
jgi:methylenetetrahydrofolate dehydrogenase (NADP+)/methenyltetrahydrofolate cyclohydrolase